MSFFLDSSALVKLYADESESELIREMDAVAVSALARVEVPAALWSKRRIGELTGQEAGILVAEFEADWFGTSAEPPRFAAIALTAGQLDQAAALTSDHDLRAYDAVQLAAAVGARDADAGCEQFVCFDHQLGRAAGALGFRVLPERAQP